MCPGISRMTLSVLVHWPLHPRYNGYGASHILSNSYAPSCSCAKNPPLLNTDIPPHTRIGRWCLVVAVSEGATNQAMQPRIRKWMERPPMKCRVYQLICTERLSYKNLSASFSELFPLHLSISFQKFCRTFRYSTDRQHFQALPPSAIRLGTWA